MFGQKGHMKEIEIGGGTLALVLTLNPLELDELERELVYALVDRIKQFEQANEQSMGVRP